MNEDTKRAGTRQDLPWHAMETHRVLPALDTREQGLDPEEASRRLDEHGPNLLPREQGPGPVRRFLKQFNNVLIYILIIASAFTAFLGEWVETAVILAVVVINAVIGFIQEGKAQRALESIRGMLSVKALVRRGGREREIGVEGLVPGDIVLLASGDKVPADLRIISARGAQIQEAVLTGESEPVNKQIDPVEEDAALGDRTCMAYSGTVVGSGRLAGVVTATGTSTEIGRISEMVAGVEELSTPLLRKIDSFGRGLSVVIVLLSAGVFALGYLLLGLPFTEMFMAVVSLAVAAIPEGLPAIMTITLALGVQRMAEHNAIVRRLPSVETLGSVTVICSDKTGTLTRNEMTVSTVCTADGAYSVSGAGYRPRGEFRLQGHAVSPDEHAELMDLIRAGLLASDARLVEENGAWTIQGMPTEGSMVVLARKAGLTREEELKERPRTDIIPFESKQRYMASLHEDPGGGSVVYVKGAPERLLDMCTSVRTRQGDRPIETRQWVERGEELADTGHRVLAIASKSIGRTGAVHDRDLSGLTLLGLVGIMDPPRQEAVKAVEVCRRAGIQVKMITGDHVLTARSIGESLGIGDGLHAVSGRELDRASGPELSRMVEENDVFARSSPEHKLRIMESLQAGGHVVAMTGDGVNDAPALKRADVGVAMGIKGSEATKEAADMVLADDNFATIERAVEEGRTIYDNLVKTILFILPTNGAESLVIIVGVLALSAALPITPIQVLWVNMVTTVTLALALSFEPPEENIMKRRPRPPSEPLISKYLLWRILLVSVLVSAAVLALFHASHSSRGDIVEARTVSVNVLVACELFYLFSTRFLQQSSLSLRAFLGNPQAIAAVGALIVLQLGFTYLGIANTLLGTSPLPAGQWIWISGAGLAVFLVVEAEKAVTARLSRESGPPRA